MRNYTSLLKGILNSVRRAYRRRVLETHPDRLKNDASEGEKVAAAEQFRSVSVLRHPAGQIDLTVSRSITRMKS